MLVAHMCVEISVFKFHCFTFHFSLVKGHVDEPTADVVDDDKRQSSHHEEALHLVKNMPDTVSRHNVILSHDSLRLLGILHESLVRERER